MTPSRLLKNWLITAMPLMAMLLLIIMTLGQEAQVIIFFREHREAHPVLKGFLNAVTNWGNIGFYVAYLGFLIYGFRNNRNELLRFVGVYIIVQLALSLVLVRFTKTMLGRPRPGNGLLFDPWSSHGSHHALPSGHTTEVTVSAFSISLWHGHCLISLAMGFLIALMAFSRIYLGWHHPTDVFFGFMLGSIGGLAVYLFALPGLNRKRSSGQNQA